MSASLEECKGPAKDNPSDDQAASGKDLDSGEADEFEN